MKKPTKTFHHLRNVGPLGEGLPNMTLLQVELQDMTDVLLGRELPPIDTGLGTLMETANAYFGRAKEIEMQILDLEAHGKVLRGTHLYKFRTGPLRSFIDLSKAAWELGSRRVSLAQMEGGPG
jgi:hypothetical protein